MASKHPEHKSLIAEELKKQKILEKEFDFNDSSLKPEEVWTVTVRTGRKHKIYPKAKSVLFRGIENPSNRKIFLSI